MDKCYCYSVTVHIKNVYLHDTFILKAFTPWQLVVDFICTQLCYDTRYSVPKFVQCSCDLKLNIMFAPGADIRASYQNMFQHRTKLLEPNLLSIENFGKMLFYLKNNSGKVSASRN